MGWENTMAQGDDIYNRLIDYGVAAVQLCNALPKTREATHIGGQLLRCGTAGGPNYAEARSAESRQDFVHKLGIVLKELNESLAWLESLRRLKLAPTAKLDPLASEGSQLARIIMTSIKTASGRTTRRSS